MNNKVGIYYAYRVQNWDADFVPFVGALMLFVLSNIFNILNVPSYSQDVFKGLIIVAAVLMQRKRA